MVWLLGKVVAGRCAVGRQGHIQRGGGINGKGRLSTLTLTLTLNWNLTLTLNWALTLTLIEVEWS